MNKLIKLKDQFLAWLLQYMETGQKRQYGADIKCPGCKEWFSVSGVNHKHEYLEDMRIGCTVQSDKCGTISNWNLVTAPVPLR